MAEPQRAVFLDRDGTLIVDKDYLHRPEEVEFFPGVFGALRELTQAGFLLVMVTNQSGVGRGLFTLEDVERVHRHIESILATEEVHLAAIYVAPEAPDAPSRGRKPSPQFLLDAQEELGIDLARSYIVGDKRIDLECGWNAGIRRSLLVRTGYGRGVEEKEISLLPRAVVVDDLAAAARWIVADQTKAA